MCSIDSLGLNGIPILPAPEIIKEGGVIIEHYYPNDHGPAHAYVYEIGNKGRGTKIGENGKPLKGERALTTREMKVVGRNKAKIRKDIQKIRKHIGVERYGEAYSKRKKKSYQKNNVYYGYLDL